MSSTMPKRHVDLLNEVQSPFLGIILDPANLLSPETLPEQKKVIAQAAQLLGGSVVLAHAKDIDLSGRVTAAGRGAVDFPAFVAALRSIGYDGALIAHGFPQENAAEVSKLLARTSSEAQHDRRHVSYRRRMSAGVRRCRRRFAGPMAARSGCRPNSAAEVFPEPDQFPESGVSRWNAVVTAAQS